MKKPETHNEMKARAIQLRKDVVGVIEQHGQLTCHQIARLLNISSLSVAPICVGLVNAGYLENGPPAKSESKKSHTIQTFVRVANPDPVPDDYKLIKKSYYQPRLKVARDPYCSTGQTFKAEAITAEDLEWMKKYKLQRQQRYARFGESAPAVN